MTVTMRRADGEPGRVRSGLRRLLRWSAPDWSTVFAEAWRWMPPCAKPLLGHPSHERRAYGRGRRGARRGAEVWRQDR